MFGGLSAGAGLVLRLGARLVFLFLAARLFGAALFGAFSVAVAVVELAVAVGGLGMKRYLFKLLEERSGTSRAEMRRFAEMLKAARNGIFVWSMGLTQHTHGVDTIQALINVALARGWVGREKTGLMPIRGHSGVQGGAEVGCAPGLEDAQRRRFEEVWGFACPTFPGLSAAVAT